MDTHEEAYTHEERKGGTWRCVSDILRCKMSTRDIPVQAIRTSNSRRCLKEGEGGGGAGRQRGDRGRGGGGRRGELLEAERMRARSPAHICADIESDVIHHTYRHAYRARVPCEAGEVPPKQSL